MGAARHSPPGQPRGTATAELPHATAMVCQQHLSRRARAAEHPPNCGARSGRETLLGPPADAQCRSADARQAPPTRDNLNQLRLYLNFDRVRWIRLENVTCRATHEVCRGRLAIAGGNGQGTSGGGSRVRSRSTSASAGATAEGVRRDKPASLVLAFHQTRFPHVPERRCRAMRARSQATAAAGTSVLRGRRCQRAAIAARSIAGATQRTAGPSRALRSSIGCCVSCCVVDNRGGAERRGDPCRSPSRQNPQLGYLNPMSYLGPLTLRGVTVSLFLIAFSARPGARHP
jgi:hypothetical protein